MKSSSQTILFLGIIIIFVGFWLEILTINCQLPQLNQLELVLYGRLIQTNLRRQKALLSEHYCTVSVNQNAILQM